MIISMNLFGGGPFKNIEHRHFWKAAALLIILLVGLWIWYYYRVRYDVRAEQSTQAIKP